MLFCYVVYIVVSGFIVLNGVLVSLGVVEFCVILLFYFIWVVIIECYRLGGLEMIKIYFL